MTGSGVVVQDGVEYHDVTSGFYVLPRLQDNNVTLLIAPRLSRVSPNQAAIFDVQNVETTASGRLGEWIQIGGISRQYNNKSKRNLVDTKQRGQEHRNILLKVEELK